MKKVTPGEPIRIRAEDWNALADILAAQGAGARGLGGVLGSLSIVNGLSWDTAGAQRYTLCGVTVDDGAVLWEDDVCPEDCPVLLVPYPGGGANVPERIGRFYGVGILLDEVLGDSQGCARVLISGGSWCWIPDQDLVNERPSVAPLNLRYALTGSGTVKRTIAGPIVVKFTTSRTANVRLLGGFTKAARLCYVEISPPPPALPVVAVENYDPEVDPPVVKIQAALQNIPTQGDAVYCKLPYPAHKYPNVRTNYEFWARLLPNPETVGDYTCHFSAVAGHLDAHLGATRIIDPRVIDGYFNIPPGWELTPVPTTETGYNYHVLRHTNQQADAFQLMESNGHYHEVKAITVDVQTGSTTIHVLDTDERTEKDINVGSPPSTPVPTEGIYMIRRIK